MREYLRNLFFLEPVDINEPEGGSDLRVTSLIVTGFVLEDRNRENFEGEGGKGRRPWRERE